MMNFIFRLLQWQMDCRVLFCVKSLPEWDTYLVVRMAASGAGFLWHCVDLPVVLPLPGGTFSAVVYIYEQFENLRIFQVLQTYMRPIVAGLLLSVSTSMLYQNVNLAGWYGWPKAGMALLTIGVILLNIFWRRRGVVRPLQSVLFSAAASLAMCNVFASIP